MKFPVLLILVLNFNTGRAEAKKVSVATPACGPNQHWVTAFPRHGHILADGTMSRGSPAVTPHCQDNPPSYPKWRTRLLNVRPSNWPDANLSEKTKNWTDEQIERVLEALDALPNILWADSIKSISRMDKSIFPNNAGSNTPENIVLYDRAFGSDLNLARVLAHELAHTLFANLSREEKANYAAMNGWYDKNEFGLPPKGERDSDWKTVRTVFVEDDGRLNMEEDFANNAEYFLFNKAKLRSRTPSAYEWDTI